MFCIINRINSVLTLQIQKITGLRSEFPITCILMHSLSVNAIWQVGLVIRASTALIGIANSAFSHEFGCSAHPLPFVTDYVTELINVPSTWVGWWIMWLTPMTFAPYDTQPDPDLNLDHRLACITGKKAPATIPSNPPDFAWTCVLLKRCKCAAFSLVTPVWSM